MREIHDYTDRPDWTSKISNWEWYFGDIVIGQDPQERCGDETYAVYEIVPDPLEHVVCRGLFWRSEDARRFAEALAQMPLNEGAPDDGAAGDGGGG